MKNRKIERYYAILEIDFPSSQQEMKKSFHRLAHIHHPDKGGDAEKFKELSEAYQFLNQPGYWDMIQKEAARRGKASNQTGDKSKVDFGEWRPTIICADDGSQYWTEDSYGFVTHIWRNDPMAYDAAEWQKWDDSSASKDYASIDPLQIKNNNLKQL